MGKDRTSPAAHNAYNKRVYDRVGVMLPKGSLDPLKLAAKEAGQSVNAYIKQAIAERMERARSGYN